MDIIRQVRGLSQAEAELISAGNDRLLAKRDARERLKAEGKLDGRGDIPVWTAGELIAGVLSDMADAISAAGETGRMRIKPKMLRKGSAK